MTGLEQTAPEKETQPVERPDDEGLYERADLFRRFNTEMVEEMAAMAGSTATERAAVFKRTSAMLTEIINEDRNHLSLIQRHGWQGTEEGKHTGDPADEPESKPSA